jgi:hypothetical protein
MCHPLAGNSGVGDRVGETLTGGRRRIIERLQHLGGRTAAENGRPGRMPIRSMRSSTG